MKKLLITLLFAFVGSLFIYAQPTGDIEAIRVGYLTRKLNLTTAEAKVFWPVYDAYREEMKGLRDDQRGIAKETRQNFDTMSDKEVEVAIDQMLNNRRKELEITLKYHEEFKKVLPIRKVAKLYKAEIEFTQLLLDRLQNRPSNANGGGKGGPGQGPGMRRF